MLLNPYRFGSGGGGSSQVLSFVSSGSPTYWSLTNSSKTATRTATANSVWHKLRCVAPKSSGKWYIEFVIDTLGTSDWAIGIAVSGTGTTSAQGGTDNAGDGGRYQYFSSNGRKRANGTYEDYGATYGASDVIGVAFDGDANTVTLYKNGASQGVMYSGLTGTYEPHICKYAEGGSIRIPDTALYLPSGYSIWTP